LEFMELMELRDAWLLNTIHQALITLNSLNTLNTSVLDHEANNLVAWLSLTLSRGDGLTVFGSQSSSPAPRAERRQQNHLSRTHKAFVRH
jgi:hypothetical protein